MTEGERWARELLAELRAARFRPQAWHRFLARSFERAGARRRERRREHRQTVALAGLGLVVWTAVGLAGTMQPALIGSAWWLLTMLMLDWHLGMLERPDGRVLGRLGTSNVLSLVRIGVVPALPVLGHEGVAAALVVAGTTNALDGWLARRRDEVTRLGFWLDGVADALVLGTAAVVLPLPGWAAALVLARFVLPAAALILSYFWLLTPPTGERVRARIPGIAVWGGLVLFALELPFAAEVAALGALGGLLASGLQALRQARTTSRATASARPQRPGMLRSSISPIPSGSTGSTASSSPSG